MSEAALERFPRYGNGGLFVPLFLAASIGFHVLLFTFLSRYSQRVALAPARPLELVVVDVPKPPPPKVEEKKPDPPKLKQKPPPIKVASVKEPPPPPKENLPPPPNDAPPPTPTKPVPLITGLSMSSTTTAGSFAAPVGNTLYGKMADKAVAPAEVKPYSAPKYTPIYQVDSEPVVLQDFKVPYPEEARKANVEGSVLLSITVDNTGTVVFAKVINGPGYGLNEAALAATKKIKFKPAVKNGEAVSTEMKYTYTFLLD